MKVKSGKSTVRKSKKVLTKKKKKDLSTLSTDEFFEQDFGNEIASDDDMSTLQESAPTKQKQQNNDDDNESDSGESDMDPMEHKRSLVRLKETDPEFYSYLKENDKDLLDFNVSDEDSEDDDANKLQEEDDKAHIPSNKLEVASDESEYEPDDDDGTSADKRKITLQLLKSWQEQIQTDKSMKTIKCAVDAFHAALQTVAESSDGESLRYKVDGSAVFNGVVQLCVLHLPEAFRKFLNLDSDSHFQAHKCKRFGKVKGVLKLYLADLLKILQNVTSANILTVLLKHLHQMLPYTQSFSSLTKPLLRILIKFWSRGEETVRVVAFLSILRIATNHKESILEILLKTMYVKYVENAKFVSPTTLPGINFMRHSLVEIYLLDNNLSYSHAFLYIRQLAIHLRNAMTLKKKENFQAVYNWQYINSLRFWVELISTSKPDSMLRSLLYPLVQIIIGTIKVIPTAQYYPLRFHCAQMLISLSKDTNAFIPVLPFLLEVLNSFDFNKKHKTVTMKPIPFICILRMSKAQLQENGFKDNTIEQIYQLILESAANESHKVYFPDLYIPCVIQLKAFLKKCRVANYCRKMKQLLDKIEENRKYIETERNKTIIDLKDTLGIKNWENKLKTQGTSLAKFYESWIKIHQSQKLKLLTKNDEVAEFNLPVIRKKKHVPEEDDDESEAESEFDLRMKTTDGVSIDELKTKTKTKTKTSKPKKKKVKLSKEREEVVLPKENTDIVKDITSADWD